MLDDTARSRASTATAGADHDGPRRRRASVETRSTPRTSRQRLAGRLGRRGRVVAGRRGRCRGRARDAGRPAARRRLADVRRPRPARGERDGRGPVAASWCSCATRPTPRPARCTRQGVGLVGARGPRRRLDRRAGRGLGAQPDLSRTQSGRRTWVRPSSSPSGLPQWPGCARLLTGLLTGLLRRAGWPAPRLAGLLTGLRLRAGPAAAGRAGPTGRAAGCWAGGLLAAAGSGCCCGCWCGGLAPLLLRGSAPRGAGLAPAALLALVPLGLVVAAATNWSLRPPPKLRPEPATGSAPWPKRSG